MIYLIITATINNKVGVVDYEHRKKRYLDSINEAIKYAKMYNIKPIVVENSCKNSYIDNLECDVIYTDSKEIIKHNKGINELNDIKYIISKYNMNDDDIVIKLTGRYKLLSDDFFKLVSINKNYDSFLKFFNVCTLQNHPNLDDCVLGLYAIKAKYIKSFDFKGDTSPEIEFALFNKEVIIPDKLYNVQHLNLECCFADNLRILVV